MTAAGRHMMADKQRSPTLHLSTVSQPSHTASTAGALRSEVRYCTLPYDLFTSIAATRCTIRTMPPS